MVPGVIRRNMLAKPGWYTQYTPYQAEIAQGRLEALLNFQTMITDLTGMEIANASLLDESTAAAEAMAMQFSLRANKEATSYFVSSDIFPQTLDVITTRALSLGITLIRRSEEHTSELQSLMRRSYDVFCLIKKTSIQLFLLELTRTYSNINR